MEDGVTLEAPAVQPEVAASITTMIERRRRQQRQPIHLQNCEVNLDDEIDDNGDLIHFAFLQIQNRETCRCHSTPQMAKGYE